MGLRERAVAPDGVALTPRDMTGGQIVRVYRGDGSLGVGAGRLEAGDGVEPIDRAE